MDRARSFERSVVQRGVGHFLLWDAHGRGTLWVGSLDPPLFHIIKVFTRKCPDPQLSFHEVRSAISCGPPWPTLPDVTEPLWGLMQQCLDEDPGSRPNALEVLRALTSQVRSSRKSAHLERSQHRTTMKTRFDVLRFLGLGGGLGLGRTESCL